MAEQDKIYRLVPLDCHRRELPGFLKAATAEVVERLEDFLVIRFPCDTPHRQVEAFCARLRPVQEATGRRILVVPDDVEFLKPVSVGGELNDCGGGDG